MSAPYHHQQVSLGYTDTGDNTAQTAEPTGNTTGQSQHPGYPHTHPDGSEQSCVSKSDYDAMVAGYQSQIEHLTRERDFAKDCLLAQHRVTTTLLKDLSVRDATIAVQNNMLNTCYSNHGPIPAADTGSVEQTTVPSAASHSNTGYPYATSQSYAASSGAGASVGTVQQTQPFYGQPSQGNPATPHNPGHHPGWPG
ncbi:hypothetical protein L204_106216 [Cryptococcus depauperatus]